MKTDLYTKTVLTVIAGALLLLVGRSFQNPAPVFAQRAAPQHVIIDGDQHVIIDGIATPMLNSLPVQLRERVHVTIDDLNPTMSSLPVHLKGIDPGVSLSSLSVAPFGQQTVNRPSETPWEYAVNDCDIPTLNRQAGIGWELVSVHPEPYRAFTFDSKAGRGVLGRAYAPNVAAPGVDTLCMAFMRRARR